jgi:hypothetical protein
MDRKTAPKHNPSSVTGIVVSIGVGTPRRITLEGTGWPTFSKKIVGT